jgi:hypothetical protein
MSDPAALIEAITRAADRVAVPGPSAPNHAAVNAAIREAARGAAPEDLYRAAEHFRERPDIAAPLLEDVIDAEPNNSRAMVRLANCYWMLGAGPQPVADLAGRAIAIDPADRAAWHLWALAEESPRQRIERWRQVAERFPEDNLALANVADNAASVAGAEHDYEMVDVAIAAYEKLVARAHRPEERQAVTRALETLRAWRF